MRMLFWIIVPLLFVIVIVFAVRNYAVVDVSLWPILTEAVALPIYAVALIALFIGFLWGGLIAWMQGHGGRARRRQLARRLEAERQEAAVMRDKLARLESAEKSATIPAPPAGIA
jgi:uncharacterized integral membrane protein